MSIVARALSAAPENRRDIQKYAPPLHAPPWSVERCAPTLCHTCATPNSSPVWRNWPPGTAPRLPTSSPTSPRSTRVGSTHLPDIRPCPGTAWGNSISPKMRLTSASRPREPRGEVPALFAAIADGHLHLAGIVCIAPHVTRRNAKSLIRECSHKTRSQIEQVVARRFPKRDVPTSVRPVEASPAPQLVSEPVAKSTPIGTFEKTRVAAPPARMKTQPLSEKRFELRMTIDASTHDKLQYARDLLSHQLPSGDLPRVLDKALDALIAKLEKRKFAATDRPRRQRRAAKNPRTIPARVKREVWKRDGGRCTFVSASGKRCESRKFLEFDHVEPVARGGKATTHGVRLLCRAHNQHEADETLGAGFIATRSARPRSKYKQSATSWPHCERWGCEHRNAARPQPRPCEIRKLLSRTASNSRCRA